MVLGGRPELAQAQAAADSAPAMDGVLQEITVSARKRTESLQDIPEAVTAFDARSIEEARIENIVDAISLTPGISVVKDQQPGSAVISIRGVSQNRGGEPPAAFVVDGVPLANAYEYTQALFDIERIELLKGPQGSLYGRNAIGGAINITTRQPGNEVEGNVNVRVARGDEYKVGGSISGPIVEDKAFFRLSGVAHDTDGLIDNITLNRKVDEARTRSVRGKLLLTPTDALRIDLGAFYSRFRGGAGWWAPASRSPFGLNATTPLYVPQGDVFGTAPRDHKSASAKIDYEFGPVTLTSITGGVDLKESLTEDYDMTSSSILEGTATEHFRSVTQEFRLTSDTRNALRWVAGAFFQHTKFTRRTNVFINSNAPAPFGGGDGNPGTKSLIEVANLPIERTYDAYALFGQADYEISDALTATLGLRYDTEDRDQKIPAGLPKASFSALQPKFSLAYKINPDFLTYATVARGYRPGGFNDSATLSATFAKESLISYELGVKTTLFENRLILNAAAYHQDFNDQQFYIVDGNGQQQIINGDKTKINGVELEFRAQLLSRLQLSGGIGYNDTDIRSFGSLPNLAFDVSAFRGNKVPLVPEYNAVLTAQYTQPLWNDLSWQGRIDYRREGRSYAHPDNASKIGDYELADARVSLQTERWTVSLFGENIFDERYVTSQFDNAWSGIISGVDIAWVPPPRTYGVEASFKF